jgi:hypothetical protein
MIFKEGYYFKNGAKYWAFLKETSHTIPGWMQYDHFILLCFDESADRNVPVNQLQAGLIITMLYDVNDNHPIVASLAQLRGEDFSATQIGQSVKLTYKGKVLKSIIRSGMTMEMWLKFKIKVSKDRDKLVSTIGKLHPLLEKEPDAHDILKCSESLISEVGE